MSYHSKSFMRAIYLNCSNFGNKAISSPIHSEMIICIDAEHDFLMIKIQYFIFLQYIINLILQKEIKNSIIMVTANPLLNAN